MSKKWTIAVDFDGVINSYTSGWSSPLIIEDPIMPGAIDFLEEMVKYFKVVIYTCRITPRENTEAAWVSACAARDAVTVWMIEQGVPVPVVQELEFWMNPGKPTALVYIDDRGFRFEGTFPTKNQIHQLKPWKVTDVEEDPDTA